MNFNKYVSNRVKSVEISTIRYFFDAVNEVKDAIPLCIGEPDFTTPVNINQAAIKALVTGKTFYTPSAGLLELRKEISQWLERNYQLKYDPNSEIATTVGATQAIDVAIRTLTEPRDEVLIPQPSFISYGPCTLLAGGKPIYIPTYPKDNFILRPDVLRKYITEKSKFLILSYPNNPTGAVMTREQLNEIAAIVLEKDLLVISDEIYSELTYGVKHIAFAGLEKMHDRTITINGFSKSYAMTGWRLGYLAAPKRLTEEMLKVHQYNVTCASTISQFAGVETLKNGDKNITDMREEYDKRRKFVLNALKGIGFECFEPKGAFYVFPSIKHTGISSEVFAKRLLYEGKVAVIPGNAFGESGEGFVRVAYSTSMDNLKKAMDRVEAFINKL